MSAPPVSIDPAALQRALELASRKVSVEELREAQSRPLSQAERAEVLSLVRWFCQRYPTAADRLRYVRRAFERWSRHRG